MGGVRADEASVTGRRLGLEVPADVAGGKTDRAQRACGHVGEVLADASTLREHLTERGGDIGCVRVEDEATEDGLTERQSGIDHSSTGREGTRREGDELTLPTREVDEGRGATEEADVGCDITGERIECVDDDLPGRRVLGERALVHGDDAVGLDAQAGVGLVKPELAQMIPEDIEIVVGL